MRRRRLGRDGLWGALCVGLALLTACGGSSAGSEPPTPTIAAGFGTPPADIVDGPCVRGRLTVGDLTEIDAVVAAALDGATKRAMDWQEDAQLMAFRVGCELLEPAFHWRGTFFSERIQTYFFSDTGETEVAATDERPGAILSLDGVSFNDLGLSLLRAGYVETATFDPGSNVEVRMNSRNAPFGPEQAPQDEVLFHVALDSRGEIIDLFVSAETGTVYEYSRQAMA